MDEHLEANRKHWDEIVPIHLSSDFYEVESFKATKPEQDRAIGVE